MPLPKESWLRYMKGSDPENGTKSLSQKQRTFKLKGSCPTDVCNSYFYVYNIKEEPHQIEMQFAL